MNITILTGNLGSDPELSYLPGTGTAKCTFPIGTKSNYKKDVTNWNNIEVFGKPAENCANYLKKGSKVLVRGELQDNIYTNKEGKKVYAKLINAERVEFLDSKKTQNNENNQQPQVDDLQPLDDDDIPF